MNESKISILVVDDDHNLRELLVDTLIGTGYATDAAVDGFEALKKLRLKSYDLMISDIRMPGMDGIRLLQKVRSYYPDMPVLFITGFATPEIIGRASPDGFLAKPFRISAMEQLIEEALAGRQDECQRQIRKVLVVDDDDLFRRTLTEALRYHDFTPTAVQGGEEALRELENGSIDAVIADIKMPGMDGIALLKRIKAKYPDLPVILITGFLADNFEAIGTAAMPADGFLQKPFDTSKIIALLEELSPTTPNPA
ncbi:MAG: response regulator [candidate division Zixibacteria bacterium]|nr:response regulator [candidate division Zixibacteria bacterium]